MTKTRVRESGHRKPDTGHIKVIMRESHITEMHRAVGMIGIMEKHD